ncbi:MAG TPA: hypothetical protein DD716_00590 [Thiomicrospira sp.]|jgi:hypothetical protein|nr:hypothetical protein [Thiomicrospira sp.]
MRAFSSLVLSFFAASLVSIVVIMTIGVSPVDKLYWVGFSLPLIWLMGMFYSYWDDKAWRPLVVMLGLSVLSVILIILLPMPAK